jgi:hypothetical protein|tara:strand:+ start:269 stop:418 length:150 start_codon:yes stop_codon:yes gene_type:complete
MINKWHIALILILIVSLLITRMFPDKMWIAALLVVGALIWAMMKQEDKL